MFEYNCMTSTGTVLRDFVSWAISEALDPYSQLCLDDVFYQEDLFDYLYPDGICEMCSTCTSCCDLDNKDSYTGTCPIYRFLIARGLQEPVSRHLKFVCHLEHDFRFPVKVDGSSPWTLAQEFGIPTYRINGNLLFL